jgi:LemA protein
LAVLAVLAAPLTGCSYNKFVSQEEEVKAAWAQVQNQLQRRNDLIPNLVETVKGYAQHEESVFKDIAEARSRLLAAKSPEESIQAANQQTSALGRLLAVVENYPQLRANEQFNRLSDELAGTENRIAVERMRYNEKVQAYNTSRSCWA